MGHYRSECPHKKKVYVRHIVLLSTIDECHHEFQVLLDNQADISIIDKRLLTNIRKLSHPIEVVGINGGKIIFDEEGDLKDFFTCLVANENCNANILCQSDVEDLYDIKYKQGESYIVKLLEKDLLFARRDKLYVADMSDWKINENIIMDAQVNHTKKDMTRTRKLKSS